MGGFEFEKQSISGPLVVKPVVHGDARGFFLETYRANEFADHGMTQPFVQDNHSHSARGVLRGMHFQQTYPQAKLLCCLAGAIYDVAVDLRAGSSTYGRWIGVELTSENHWSLFIPRGFAHGFLVLSDEVDVEYKCDDYYHPEDEGGLLWDDPTVGIVWPTLDGMSPLLSGKDMKWPTLDQLGRRDK
jgi:dTDP-4-dehydrorhamnose 3,5-epimerase